jgi:hypothetical protein
MNATQKNTLLWNEDGQIGCSEKGHAPHPGTDTWRRERWRPITLAERIDFEAELGRPVQCETCAADARHSRR